MGDHKSKSSSKSERKSKSKGKKDKGAVAGVVKSKSKNKNKNDSLRNHAIPNATSQITAIRAKFSNNNTFADSKMERTPSVLLAIDSVLYEMTCLFAAAARDLAGKRQTVMRVDMEGAVENVLVSADMVREANSYAQMYVSSQEASA